MFNRKISFQVGLTQSDGAPIARELVVENIAYAFARLKLDGFSIVEQVGYWKGVQETSLCASCYLDATSKITGYELAPIARDLAVLCNQEAVLWSIDPATANLVYAPNQQAAA